MQLIVLRNSILRYGFAAAMVVVAVGLRQMLTPILGAMTYQYITVFPAIIVVAIFAGMGPAVVTAAVASVTAEYFFSAGVEITDISAIGVVIASGFLAGWLAQRLHRALEQSQKNANALAESEEKFRLLAENARAVVGIVQGERFLYVNPYFEETSGYTNEELLGMPITQIVHPDSRAEVLERAKRRQAGEKVEHHYEFAILTKSGEKRLLDFSATRINYQGRPAIVGIAIDITERKQVEEALVRTKLELENKSNELESIIGIVSHDLRAPLFSVSGFAHKIGKNVEILHKKLQQGPAAQSISNEVAPLFDDFRQSLYFINASSEAMNNLAKSLVDIARAGLGAVKPEQLDMNELINKVVSSIQFKFKTNNVKYDIEPNLPSCFGDRQQITQIFTNLLDNAAKYLDPNRPGQICLSCHIEVDRAIYWISDNGIGIAPDNEKRIFDAYYQLHEKAAEGVGMGLAVVKRMVDRNNGKIWVYSEKDKGSTFYVALPLGPR